MNRCKRLYCKEFVPYLDGEFDVLSSREIEFLFLKGNIKKEKNNCSNWLTGNCTCKKTK
jgi:hypothetical protein